MASVRPVFSLRISRQPHEWVNGRSLLSPCVWPAQCGRIQLIYGAIKKTGKSGFAALFMIAVLLLYGGRYAEALACGEHRSG